MEEPRMKNRYTRRLPTPDHSEDTSGPSLLPGAGCVTGDLVRQFCPGHLQGGEIWGIPRDLGGSGSPQHSGTKGSRPGWAGAGRRTTNPLPLLDWEGSSGTWSPSSRRAFSCYSPRTHTGGHRKPMGPQHPALWAAKVIAPVPKWDQLCSK